MKKFQVLNILGGLAIIFIILQLTNVNQPASAKKIKKLKKLKKLGKYAYLLPFQRKKFYAIPFPLPIPVVMKRQRIYTEVPVIARYVDRPTPYLQHDDPYAAAGSEQQQVFTAAASETHEVVREREPPTEMPAKTTKSKYKLAKTLSGHRDELLSKLLGAQAKIISPSAFISGLKSGNKPNQSSKQVSKSRVKKDQQQQQQQQQQESASESGGRPTMSPHLSEQGRNRPGPPHEAFMARPDYLYAPPHLSPQPQSPYGFAHHHPHHPHHHLSPLYAQPQHHELAGELMAASRHHHNHHLPTAEMMEAAMDFVGPVARSRRLQEEQEETDAEVGEEAERMATAESVYPNELAAIRQMAAQWAPPSVTAQRLHHLASQLVVAS